MLQGIQFCLEIKFGSDYDDQRSRQTKIIKHKVGGVVGTMPYKDLGNGGLVSSSIEITRNDAV